MPTPSSDQHHRALGFRGQGEATHLLGATGKAFRFRNSQQYLHLLNLSTITAQRRD